MNIRKIALNAVYVALAIAGMLVVKQYFLPSETKPEDLSHLGFYQFNQARALNDAPLQDLEGNAVMLTKRHQDWQLVNFGYMFCPDICPINLSLLSEVKTQWDETHSTTPLRVTHITFDPVRDTPENLAKYLHYMDPSFEGFTGDLENIRQLATQLNVVFIHESADEYGNYLITHSDTIALLNPEGKFVGLFKGPYEKDKFLQVLNTVIGAPD